MTDDREALSIAEPGDVQLQFRWRRSTLREVLRRGDQVVKHYWVKPGTRRYPEPWRREDEALRRLGPPFPATFGYGVSRRMDGLDVVYRRAFVAGAPVTAWMPGDMERVARQLAQIHARGVLTLDLSRGNFLRQEDGTICFIDFGRARTLSPRDPRLWVGTGLELGRFFVEGLDCDQALMERFGAAYWEAMNGRRFRRLVGSAAFRLWLWIRIRRKRKSRLPASERFEVAHLHANRGWGGGENQLLTLCRDAGGQVPMLLVTPSGGALCQRAQAAGVSVRVLPEGIRRPLQVMRLARDLRRLGVRILHAHDSGGLDVALQLRRRMRVRVIYTRRVASPLRANPLSRRKYSPGRIDTVVCISQTVFDVMASCGFPPAQMCVVPSAVDVKALGCVQGATDLGNKFGERFLAGGVGALTEKKNWAFLIRTAGFCRRRGLSLAWVIAGDGPERTKLQELARACGVDGVLHLAGFRPDSHAVMKGLDVFFFPSRMEGASVAVREAMAMGVPVVAVDAPGVVESLDGCGWTVPDGDEEAAADAVESVLRDEGERQRRVEAARRSAAERFDLPVMVGGYLRLYREMRGRP